MTDRELNITFHYDGKTLAACVRALMPTLSWNAVKRLIEARHVTVDGELCLDAARRLRLGQLCVISDQSAPKPRVFESITIRHLDEHLVVVEKPAGINSVRHPVEREWSSKRKALSPALEDFVPKRIAVMQGHRANTLPRLRIVHRLDKATSGLLVMARNVRAERGLGMQFRAHTVLRRYLALVPGVVATQRIRSYLMRDRGDGLRGSAMHAGNGKEAITHVELLEKLPGYSLLWCKLQTGRTHQIRIHLAELGHAVVGEKVYGEAGVVPGAASRLFLHAAELGFVHPITQENLFWTMPLPVDLEHHLQSLRREESSHSANPVA